MKTFIAVLVAAGLGFGVAYFIVAKNNEARLAAERDAAKAASAEEVGKLNAALSNAYAKVGQSIIAAPVNALPPKELLHRLSMIDPAAPEGRARKIREVIHHLESLVDIGTNSFEPMREFLATGTDVDYVIEDARQPVTIWTWHPGSELRSGLVLPPTLRISLVDVMRYIGTEEAEVSLAWMLSASAHGMEIPYVAMALEKVAPERYRDLALQTARLQLENSLTNKSLSPAEAMGNGYIFSWLASRGDTSMVAVARQAMTGKFNPEAARYLVNALKENAMGDLAQAYANTTDGDTKNQIAHLAFDYLGSNPTANNIFSQWLTGSDVTGAPGTVNARPREMVIRLMAGGDFGPFSAPPPKDAATIDGRLSFLQGIRPSLQTPRLEQALEQTVDALNKLKGGTGK